ncbi:rac GTPase-activating protein 1-like [Protopterus annectens]|uniref:rac GTPase-activating protein 1-like n=1 Tax=Protopterus annectens TaxID=7888 RepID=UPI001CFA6E05|nr:rac GTPase-activating protein 1-like [Protopterus annectens]
MSDASKKQCLNKLEMLLKLANVVLNSDIELEYMQIFKQFEECRRRWQQELSKTKELLLKSEVSRSAMEVKLKHARNQVDVEMRKRHKAEAECEKLTRQLLLIHDLIMHDEMTAVHLNSEQRLALANLSTQGGVLAGQKDSRLSAIDESGGSFLSHSNISYDQTEDDLEVDSFAVRPFLLKKREKRGTENVTKNSNQIANNSQLLDTTSRRRSRKSKCFPIFTDLTSVWNDESENSIHDKTEQATEQPNSAVSQKEGSSSHKFMTKTTIHPETCMPCGKKIRFGKLSIKCRDCRLVAHPECRDRCPRICLPNCIYGPVNGEGVLADFAPTTAPMIPSLIVHCVKEVEERGLSETGIYRISGCERTIKDLKQKFLRGKGVPLLSKVSDIHVVCGLLKDFLRNLKEPLVTFRLHSAFMKAVEITDDDNSIAAIYQAVGELPKANRDTMAFLMLHLQKVMGSPVCKMDKTNLARVFGPTLIGHAVPEPSPLAIMQDTAHQSKVVARLLSIPAEYWKPFILSDNLKTAPAVSLPTKIPSSSSLTEKIRLSMGTALTPISGNQNKSDASKKKPGRYFVSPTLN